MLYQGQKKPKSDYINIIRANERVEEILREIESGKSAIEIAKERGCSKQNIYEMIKRYKNRQKEIQKSPQG